MEPGTIVVCVDDSMKIVHRKLNIIIPKKNKIYMIRRILDSKDTASGETGVYLEEIINPTVRCRMASGEIKIMEPAYRISRFQEIKSDISEIIQLLNQPILIPVE